MRTLQAVVRDDDVALQLHDRAAVLCRLLLARVVVDDALLLACGVVDDALRGHGRHGLLQLDLAVCGRLRLARRTGRAAP